MLIKVVRNGRVIREIERPVRTVAGRRVVTYKGEKYPLKGDSIDVSSPPGGNRRMEARTETKADGLAEQSRTDSDSAKGGVEESQASAAAPSNGVEDADGSPYDVGETLSAAAEAGTTSKPKPILLTDEQKAVACASSAARILVQAGPGTGKTETVAFRLVHLLDEGVRPSEILVLSFSRNAVKTLASRIEGMQASAAGHVEDLRHLSVRTFDSWTFRMLRQLNAQPAELLKRSYDENIDSLIAQLSGESNGAVRQLLERVKHVIVDEFQDLSGVRGALVVELLKTIAPPQSAGAGFTVLGDMAQAIYGFALRNGIREYQALTSGALMQNLADLYQSDVSKLSLTVNFRATGALNSLTANLRRLLLRRASGKTKFKSMVEVTSRIPELEGELKPELLLKGDVGTAAVLAGTNGEAIRIAQMLMSQTELMGAIQIRLHAGSQPAAVPAWVGATLGRMKDTTLTKSQFGRIHEHFYGRSANGRAAALEVPSVEKAWGRLLRATGEAPSATALALKVLRERLKWPDLLPDDEGLRRAALHIMTIHQAKGMEFDAVAVMADSISKREYETDVEHLEAANVIFVGMTRAAKKLLRVGEGKTYRPLVHRTFRNDRRRWYSWWNGWMNIETGIPGDVDETGFIDRIILGAGGEPASEETVSEFQEFIASEGAGLCGRKVMLRRWSRSSQPKKIIYLVHLQEGDKPGRVMGVTTQQLTQDLLDVLWARGYGLPSTIFNLRISDVVTTTAYTELPETAAQPWTSSGIWLGVNIYGTGDFKTFKRR